MSLLVGWYNPKTGELVDIPGFDAVKDPENWLMATVEHHRPLTQGPMQYLCSCGRSFPSTAAFQAHRDSAPSEDRPHTLQI